MKHCITVSTLTTELFKNQDVIDLLTGENGLIDRFVTESLESDNTPFVGVFKRSTETLEEYNNDIATSNGGLFRYRASLYILKWYNDNYGDVKTDLKQSLLYEDLKNSITTKNAIGSTRGQSIPTFISSFYSNSIGKLVVANLSEIIDNVSKNGTTYRSEIIDMFVRKSIEHSKGKIDVLREVTTDHVVDDLNSVDSVIYPAIVEMLSKQYGINIGSVNLVNPIDQSKLEDETSSENGSPITWNVSDSFTTDVVDTTMSSDFKIRLAKYINMSTNHVYDMSYLPSYLSINQLTNMLSVLHSSDTTLFDFKYRIDQVAKYEDAFKPLAEIFEAAKHFKEIENPTDNLRSANEFVQQYIHVFSTAHTADIELSSDGTTRTLNANTNKENYVFFKVMERLNDRSFLDTLVSYDSNTTDVNNPATTTKVSPARYADIVKGLGFDTYVDGILHSVVDDSEPFSDATSFFNGIVSHAKDRVAKLRRSQNTDNMSLGFPIASFIKRVTSFPMWNVNLQYVNAEGNKVFTPTKPSFITSFTKGIMRGSVVSDNYNVTGVANTKRAINVFKEVLDDKTLKNSPLLHNDGTTTSYGMFATNNGEYAISNVEDLSLFTNIVKVSSFRIGDASTPYNNIFDLKSDMFLKAQLDAGLYVIHASDANSTYGMKYRTMSGADVRHGFKKIVLVDRDMFTNGVDVVGMGGIENPVRYGVSNDKLKGAAFQFKESSYMRNSKAHSYADYLIESPVITAVESLEDIRNLYLNDRTTFDSLFADAFLDEYVSQYIAYQMNDATSEFSKFYEKVGTNDSVKSDVLAKYMTHFIIGHTVNVVFNGSQSEYKNEVDYNKRGTQINKKKSVINESVKQDYKVLVFSDIVIDSPVANQLTTALPHLEKVFKGQNTTDGISYITDVAFERMLRNTGKWESFKNVVLDLRAGRTIDPTRYGKVVEELKMFGYARRAQNTIFKASNDTALASYQFKDSTAVLFRSAVEGTEFETVYDFLIENGIDQLSSQSAVKVGHTNNVKLHGLDGALNKNALSDITANGSLDQHLLYMKMSDFGPQQENVSHVVDEESTQASQMIKKIVSDLNPTEKVYKLDGKMVDGNTLDRVIQDRLSISIEHQMEDLMYKLGAYNENGTIETIEGSNQVRINFTKFKDMLRDLSATKDVPSNVKAVLDMDIQEGSVLMSLPTVYNAFKYLVLSQYNDVLKVTLPGTHLVIVPDVFRQPLTSNSDVALRGVQYSKSFTDDVSINRNGSYRLREEYGYNEKVNEHVLGEGNVDDTFHYAEIVVNPYHSAIFEEYMETRSVEREVSVKGVLTKKLVKEKYIDIDSIDPEVLKMIALRIPTDSKASIMAFKIVGFINDGASRAIVPSGLINRTGWDFDNDTIYTYHKHVKMVEGVLVPITKDNAYNGTLNGKYEAYLDRVNPQWKRDLLTSLIGNRELSVIGVYATNILPIYDPVEAKANNAKKNGVSMGFKDIDAFLERALGAVGDNPKAISTLNKRFDQINKNVRTLKVQAGDLINYITTAKKEGVNNAAANKDLLKSNIVSAIDLVHSLNNKVGSISDYLKDLGVDETLMSDMATYFNPDITVKGEVYKAFDVASDVKGNHVMNMIKFVSSDSQYKKAFDKLADDKGSLKQESQAVIDNELIDAYMAVLTSSEHVEERNRSNQSATFLSAGRVIINKTGGDKYVNFNSPITKSHYQSVNMSIGKLKGVSVAIDGSFAILQRMNAKFDQGGIWRSIQQSEFPVNEQGVPIKMTPIRLNTYFGNNNYIIEERDEKGVITKVRVNSAYIANDASNKKESIVGGRMNDYLAEMTPAIFDAVKYELPSNINDKTLVLLKLLSATPVVEFDGKQNTAFLYGMAILHHPAIVKATERAILKNTTLGKSINYFINSPTYNKLDISLKYPTTTEILNSYDVPSVQSDMDMFILVKSYLKQVSDFNAAASILKSEKKMRGDFGAYHMLRTIEDSVIEENPNNALNVVVEDHGKFIPITRALYPRYGGRSVNPYIQANVNTAYAGYSDAMSNIFVQHETDVYRMVSEIDGSYILINSDRDYTNLVDGFVNLLINRALDITSIDNEFISEVVGKSGLSHNDGTSNDSEYKAILYKQLVMDMVPKTAVKNPMYHNRLKSVKTSLKAVKDSMEESGYSIMDVGVSTNTTLKQTFLDFRSLSSVDKLEIVRSIFSDYVDSANVLHAFNISIVKDSDYKHFRYDNYDTIMVDRHAASFEEALRHNNPFIAETARDIVMNTILTNGFQFGYNVGKLIPASFLNEVYDNDLGHPVEALHKLGSLELEVLSDVTTLYARLYAMQNVMALPVVKVQDLLKQGFSSRTIFGNGVNDQAANIGRVFIPDNKVISDEINAYRSQLFNNKFVNIQRKNEEGLVTNHPYGIFTHGELVDIAELTAEERKLIEDSFENGGNMIDILRQVPVIVPLNKLLKSEFGEISMLNKYNIRDNGGSYSLKTLVRNLLLEPFVENNGMIQDLPSILAEHMIEREDVLDGNEVALEELEWLDIDPHSVELGVVDFDSPATETDDRNVVEVDNIDEIKSQIAQTTKTIIHSKSVMQWQQIDTSLFDTSIRKISNILRNDKFSYDDPKALSRVIVEIINYYDIASKRLIVIKDLITELDKDANIFKNEADPNQIGGVSKYVEYNQLLTEAANIIAVIDSINGLNIDGIEQLSKGYVDQLINGNPYIIVTKDVLFEQHRDNAHLKEQGNVIHNYSDFDLAYRNTEIARLKEVLNSDFFDENDRYSYSYHNEAGYDEYNITLTHETMSIFVKFLTGDVDVLTDVEQNTPIIVNGIVEKDVMFIGGLIDQWLAAKYHYAVKSTNQFDNVMEGIANITKSMSSITPIISIIERHRREVWAKTFTMQSRNGGLLHSKLVQALIDVGIEVTDENIDITRTEFIEMVSSQIHNASDADAVNMGIKYFGTPFNTTDSRVDILLHQFVFSRSRNRAYSEQINKQYVALKEKYNVDIKDERLFQRGNLLTKYNYESVRIARNVIIAKYRNAAAAKQDKTSGNSLVVRRQEYAKSMFAIIEELGNLYKVSNKANTALTKVLRSAIRYNSRNSEVGLYDTLRGTNRFDILESEGLTVLSYDEFMAERSTKGYDADRYFEITSLGKGIAINNTDDHIYVKFDYNDAHLNEKYKSISQSDPDLIAFVTEYDSLLDDVFKNTVPSLTREPGVLPFVSKTGFVRQAKSYIGYRSINIPSSYVDLEGNTHYRTNFSAVFESNWYTPFHNIFMKAVVDDVTSDELKVEAFRKFYNALKPSHRLALDLDNMTVDTIDEYNSKVYIANEAHKNDNQSRNLDVLTEQYLSVSEETKTAHEFDTVITGSGIRSIVSSKNTKGAIDRTLLNMNNKSVIASKGDQMAGMLLRAASLNFMALNYLSGMKNVLSGTLHALEETAPKGVVNMKDLRSAMNTFRKDILTNLHKLKDNPDDNITIYLMHLFDSIYEDTKDSVREGGLNKTLGWIDKLLYSPNSMGEVFMQFSMVLANAKSHRVTPTGQILTFSEYENAVKNDLIMKMLSSDQLKEYRIFKKGRELHNKKSVKWVSNVDDSLNDFIIMLSRSSSNNRLTVDQKDKLTNINGKLKAKRSEFNSLPTLESSITFENGVAKYPFSREALTNFIQRVAVINQNLHGIYNKLDRNAIQSKGIGEIMMQFRKWMYPMYGRYAGKHWMKNSFNEASGLVETPIMKPMVDLIKKTFNISDQNNLDSATKRDMMVILKNLGTNLVHSIGNIRLYYNMLPTHEQAAMRRSLQTISIITLTAIASSMAYGVLKDRDDDDNNKLLATMSYVIDGLFNEWSILIPFYGQYVEYEQVKRRPFVSADILVNLHKVVIYGLVLPSVYDENDPEYKNLTYGRGSRKGENKGYVALKKLFPVIRQFEKQSSIEEYAKFFEMNNVFIQMR